MPPSLPAEILLDCFDYAVVSHSNIDVPDYKCLRSLSLVSKMVSTYAQRVLFRTVFLSKARHALAFKNAVRQDTPKGYWLAETVHTLRIQLRNGPGRLTESTLTACIIACPNLYELDIGVLRHEFDDRMFAANLKHQYCHPVQALRLSGPTIASIQILCSFPSVKHLLFKEFEDITTVLPKIPVPCSLVQLHWPSRLSSWLQWILANSTSTLEILRLGWKPGFPTEYDGTFEQLMSMFGPSLRSLQVPFLTKNQGRSLRHCARLEELIYDGPITEDVLSVLPNTLEHLQVQPGRDEDPAYRLYDIKASLLSFIKSSPSLAVLTFVFEVGIMHEDLRDACEARGITWRFWFEPYGMFPGEKPVLEDIDTFPQPLQLSPLRLKELNFVLNRPVAVDGRKENDERSTVSTWLYRTRLLNFIHA